MKKLIAVMATMTLVLLCGPALADVANSVLVSTCTPVQGGIDLCPLVPVVNGLITAMAAMLTAAVPGIVFLVGKWLYSHGINLSQQTQKIVSDRITATIQNGLKYATAAVPIGVSKITIPVGNDAVRDTANYVIAQSPDLLKKAGIDVRTEEGQKTLIRRITAEAQPTPTALNTTNVTTDTPQPVGDGTKA